MRFTLACAFRCAAAGLVATLQQQKNARIHLAFAALAVVLGIVLRIDLQGWLAIVLCVMLVFGIECVNTALETVVDLVSPGYHDLAKRAKDCAAAAVLVVSIGSLVVAALVYGSALYGLLLAGAG
jgi:diacylglycerol kinase (ATP)